MTQMGAATWRDRTFSSRLRVDCPATLATTILSAGEIVFHVLFSFASPDRGTLPVLIQPLWSCSPHFSRELPQSTASIIRALLQHLFGTERKLATAESLNPPVRSEFERAVARYSDHLTLGHAAVGL